MSDEGFKEVANKLNNSLERISQVLNDFNKIIGIHDEQLHRLEKDFEKNENSMEKIKHYFEKEFKSLRSDVLTELKNHENTSLLRNEKQSDKIDKKIKDDMEDVYERLKESEKAIEDLKKSKYKVIGGTIALSAFISFLSTHKGIMDIFK